MARTAPPWAMLSGLESAFADTKEFRPFCHRFQAEHPMPEDVRYARWVQWFLEPTDASAFAGREMDEQFVVQASADWSWQDEFGDCSSTVHQGLEIQAANGRKLWGLNLSAPRFLRHAAGDFAVQTVC